MIKKIIKEHFSNCKRVTNTGVIKFLRNNSKIDKVLTRVLEKQPLWESKLNLINSVLKDIKLSRCKICNNLMPFTKHTFDFCSKECMYKDHDHYDKNALTKLQRYGSATYNNSDKAKKTSLEKYGVDNPAKAESVKNKIKETLFKKHGVINTFQLDETKEKIKNTFKQRYGVEYNSQNKEIKEKMIKSKLSGAYNRIKKTYAGKYEPMFSEEEYIGVHEY